MFYYQKALIIAYIEVLLLFRFFAMPICCLVALISWTAIIAYFDSCVSKD